MTTYLIPAAGGNYHRHPRRIGSPATPDDIINSRRWREFVFSRKHPSPSSSPAGGGPEWRRKPPLRSGTGANQLPVIALEHPNSSFSLASENVIIVLSRLRHRRNKDPQSVILAGRREKIAGSDFSRAKRARRARIRDDTRNVAAATVIRTTTFELNNWIAGTNR